MSSETAASTVTLPARAWAVLACGFAFLVIALGAMLTLLELQRGHVASQDRKITQLTQATLPLVRETSPLVRQATGATRPAGELARDVQGLARDARVTLDDLARVNVPNVLNATAYAAVLAVPVLRDLEAAGLPRVLGQVAAAANTLTDGRRLRHVLDAAEGQLRLAGQTGIIAVARRVLAQIPALVALQRTLLGVQRRTLQIQIQSFDVQRRSLQIQQETLGIQREALVHIRSLDQKTGGTAPAAGTP